MANEDALTGLANRRCFFERLEQQITASASGNEPFAVGILDLDGFKPVNDIFGHSVGDRLLQEVASRLSSSLPENALLARLGGDEFALILPAPSSDEELQKTCREALDALVPAFVFEEGSVTVSATCGLSRFPEAGGTAGELYEKADLALYYLKQQNDRGAVTIFSDQHAEENRPGRGRCPSVTGGGERGRLSPRVPADRQPRRACHWLRGAGALG
jgi:diguanylate cyclase (GGDEF)-like protein